MTGGQQTVLAAASNDSAGRIEAEGERYGLRLYVTGTTARSMLAIRNIQHICHKYLDGRYDLEVIDIYQKPQEAINAQIIAAPTLIKFSPDPVRRAVGDMSNESKVLAALNITLPTAHAR
jgi:circadian clock protein KaiB